MAIQAAALYGTVSIAGAEGSVGKLRRVSDEVDRAQGRLTRFSGAGAQVGRGLGQVAAGATRLASYFAVAAVAAVGASSKIAASFEDAFAAVEKTVEGTAPELDAIDKALRRLTTTIPVTFQGMATIASEAGALNVATKDIVKFSEAVARTSAATVGLDPFAASEAFGKLSTIFGLTGDVVANTTGKMVSDYERLGSALVALGNAGASSEADIIAVTKRFASAGQIAGLSAAEVLGWSSALASLGPEAEAAGGALQRVFNRAARNIGLVDVPGLVGKNARARVETFAAVTGMTVDEFVKLYTKDASGAMQRFILGLQGMDQFESARALFGAGVINQRDILAIQAFTTRYGVLNQQLDIANKAWAEGTELQVVSDRRFSTVLNKAIQFKNQVLLGAAAVGDGLNPALGRLIAKAQAFVQLHMGDFAKLGRDIGAEIDAIDWSAVGRGAQSFIDILRQGFELIRKIPPEIALMTAGFLGLNRLSGGLLGAGAGNIIGGLGKGFANVILAAVSKIPVIGGAVGAVTATRVFVVNFPPGFGGGIPGGAGAGAAAGAGASFLTGTLLPILAAGAVVTAIGMLVARVAHEADPERFRDPEKPWVDQTPLRPTDRNGNPILPRSNGRSAGGDWGPQLLDAHDRTPTYFGQMATSLSKIAENTAIMAGDIRVKGPVPKMFEIGELGTKADPYGFTHLKQFAMGRISSPERTGPELVRHLKLIDAEIAEQTRKGNPDVVAKLRETKAGLEWMLEQVRAGTFRAGTATYEAALLIAAAVARTTAAVNALRGVPIGTSGLLFTGIPNPTRPRTSPTSTSTTSPTTTTSPVLVPHQVAVPMASGGIVRRRPGGILARIAEGAHDEAVIPLTGKGGLSIEVHPQPVSLVISGREVATAQVLSDVFTRRG